MPHSCCFSSGGNLDFLGSLQKKFYNIDFSSWLDTICEAELLKSRALAKMIMMMRWAKRQNPNLGLHLHLNVNAKS